MRQYQQFAIYNKWVNSQIIDACLKSTVAQRNEAHRTFLGRKLEGSIIKTMVHVLEVDKNRFRQLNDGTPLIEESDGSEAVGDLERYIDLRRRCAVRVICDMGTHVCARIDH